MPSFFSSPSTFSEIASGGPSTTIRGFLWAAIAARVSAGSSSRPVHSTGWPDLAAQPAAGIAKSGRSEEATTTASDGPLAAADCRRSIARAVAAGSPAFTSVVSSPSGAFTSPIRMICAPPASAAPLGRSLSSASAVASGTESVSENSTGARTGAEPSTDAAIDARQSSWSTSTTALGRVSDEREGNTAWATAAASATGSAPPTRVVFLVAKTGNPSAGPAGSSSPLWPSTGVPCSACSFGVGLSSLPLPPPPPPPPPHPAKSRRNAMGERRRTPPRVDGQRPPHGEAPHASEGRRTSAARLPASRAAEGHARTVSAR